MARDDVIRPDAGAPRWMTTSAVDDAPGVVAPVC
jgi:hypothetical protein